MRGGKGREGERRGEKGREGERRGGKGREELGAALNVHCTYHIICTS